MHFKADGTQRREGMQRNPLKEIYGGRLSLEHIRSNYTCLLIRGCFFKVNKCFISIFTFFLLLFYGLL